MQPRSTSTPPTSLSTAGQWGCLRLAYPGWREVGWWGWGVRAARILTFAAFFCLASVPLFPHLSIPLTCFFSKTLCPPKSALTFRFQQEVWFTQRPVASLSLYERDSKKKERKKKRKKGGSELSWAKGLLSQRQGDWAWDLPPFALNIKRVTESSVVDCEPHQIPSCVTLAPSHRLWLACSPTRKVFLIVRREN